VCGKGLVEGGRDPEVARGINGIRRDFQGRECLGRSGWEESVIHNKSEVHMDF